MLTGLPPCGQAGSTVEFAFFPKGFVLVSLVCVCVYRRKGCSFVIVPVPESSSAHHGQKPSVRLNLETRQHQVFLKALCFEKLATATCDFNGRRKTCGVHNISGVVTPEALYFVLSLKVGLLSVLGERRS